MNAQNTMQTTSSSDRVAILTTPRPLGVAVTNRTSGVHFAQTARRILNALMRSLAAPHF